MVERHGQLTMIARLAERYRNGVVALWRCDCGAEKKIPISRVRTGRAKSCGCLKLRHGATGSPEHVAWSAMRARCNATRGHDADNYSGRGIAICHEWSEFSAFLRDMGQKPTARHSLGRIDNDRGYSPDNCRWETPEEQMRNTRRSMVWRADGRDYPSCRAAADAIGVDHKTIRYRVKMGVEGYDARHRY